MAKDEEKEGDEDSGGGGGGGLIPLILGALSVLLNIGILVYLILFPAGGGAESEEMALQVKALHDEVIPNIGTQVAAIAAEIVPGEEDEEGDDEYEEGDYSEEEGGDDEYYYEDEGDEYFDDVDGGADLSEITMMLTDTQLILRQMAENINSDNASIKRSVGGVSKAGRQISDMRQDLQRIEKKLNELLGDGPKKKKRGGYSGNPQFPEVEDGRISYP